MAATARVGERGSITAVGRNKRSALRRISNPLDESHAETLPAFRT
jgi:hypothetical protein